MPENPKPGRVVPPLSLALLWALAAWVAPASGQEAQGRCAVPGAEVALDHVVVAVDDLDRATATFRDLGFRFKDGRLHPGGLRNRHVKLASDEDLELMALQGDPGDALARSYGRFLAGGEGGAYLAFRAPLDRVRDEARALGLVPERTEGPAFSWITFPRAPGLAAVFFIEYAHPPADAPEHLGHPNGVNDMVAVRLEADPGLVALLGALGAKVCPVGSGDAHGDLMAVRGGRVRIQAAGSARPRVRAVTLAGPGVEAGKRRVHGLEVELLPMEAGGGPEPGPGAQAPPARERRQAPVPGVHS